MSHTEDILACRPEIDLLVSKLLVFETFANFRVLVSLSENLVSERKSRFRSKFVNEEKVSVSVSVKIWYGHSVLLPLLGVLGSFYV